MSQNGLPYADTQSMYVIHILFRREFGLLPDLVQSVPHEDTAHAKVVADHLTFVNNLLVHHHEVEDEVLWPLLLARAPKETDPVVHLAEGHHQRIDTLLSLVEARLAAWADRASRDDGEALSLALRELAVILFEHMDLEEQLILPLVERHVFATEWLQMEGRAIGMIESQDVPLVFGMALYESGADIIPEPMRDEMLAVAEQAYADYAERVHGTRTPPRAKDLVFGAPSVGVPARAGQH